MGLGEFFQLKYATHVRFQLSLFGQQGGGAENFAMALRAYAIDAGRALELEMQRGVQSEKFLRNLVRRHSNASDHMAIHRHAIQRAVKCLAAHRVKHDRAAAPAGLLLHALYKIYLAIVEDNIRAALV